MVGVNFYDIKIAVFGVSSLFRIKLQALVEGCGRRRKGNKGARKSASYALGCKSLGFVFNCSGHVLTIVKWGFTAINGQRVGKKK